MTDTEAPSRKSPVKKAKKFSIVRVLVGIIVAMAILWGVLYADQKMANLPFYQDLIPHWSSDGKTIVFARWIPVKNGYRDVFQLHRMDPDGGNRRIIYESDQGYNCFGIRRLRFSSDCTYMNMRLNRKEKSTGDEVRIRDMLVKVPLTPGEMPISWELDKKFEYDVFLAYSDNLAFMRRMKNDGSFAPNDLYQMDFDTRKPILEIPFEKGLEICTMAEYFGRDNQLYLTFKKESKTPHCWDYVLCRLEKDKIIPLFVPGIRVLYLEKRKCFVEAHPKDYSMINIRDCNGKLLKTIPNPLGPGNINKFLVSADETTLVTFNKNRLGFVNLDNFENRYVNLPEKTIADFAVSPDGKQVAFSDGSIIMMINSDGTGLKSLTEPSTRTRYLKNPHYVNYLKKRNKLIYNQEDI